MSQQFSKVVPAPVAKQAPLPGPGAARSLARLVPSDLVDLEGVPAGSLRVPALLALPGGELLLVHDLRPQVAPGRWQAVGGALPGDLPNPNRLVVRRSADGGTTWSLPALLVPDPAQLRVRGVSDPSLLLGPDGSVHLLAAASTDVGVFGAHPPTRPSQRGQYPEPGTLRLVHAVSQDAGASWHWQDLTDLLCACPQRPQGVVAFPVSGHGATLAVGEHVGRMVQPLVLVGPAGGDGVRAVGAAALLSDDAGASWYLGRDVPAPQQGRSASLAGGARTCGVDEWAVAQDARGRLVLSARDGGYGGTRLSAFSQDGGLSWSVPVAQADLPDPGCNAALAPWPARLGQEGAGGLLCSHASNPSARVDGRLSVSVDGAATWVPLAALSGAGQPFGYSDLAVLDLDGAGALAVVVAEEPSADPGVDAGLVVLALDLPPHPSTPPPTCL